MRRILAPTKFVIVIIITILIGLGGCTKNEEKDIKIGVILPLTGPGAPYGNAEREGMELASKEINSNGGIKGKQIRLIIEDSKTEPATGVSAINKLIQTDHVKVVLGDLASSVTLAIAPIAEKNKVLLITPGASSPKISEAGDYIFRLYPSDDFQGKLLAEWAHNDSITKVGVLYINNDFGVGLKDRFKQVLESKGGKITVEEGYEMGEKDFRASLAKLKRSDLDGIFIIAAGQENANILIQMKELGIKKKVFAPDAFKDESILKIAGNTAEGVVCSAPRFSMNEKRKLVENFLKKYKDTYKKEPNVFAAYGNDAVSIISNLIDKNNYDSEILKSALYKIKYEGVIGYITFDNNGDLIPKMDVHIVRDGKFMLLEADK